MKPFLYLLLLVISSPCLQSQDGSPSTRPVTNVDIIEMTRSGLQPAVLIAKIENSNCKFDTSPSALVQLKEAGVADDVLMEMVRNPNGGGPSNTQPIPPASPPASTPNQLEVKERPNDNLPEYGDISEIRKFRRVFVIADDIDSQNLMIKTLRQYGGLDLVSSPERADLFVAFTQGSTATSIVPWGVFAGTIDHRTKAQFIVYYKSEIGRSRIVWQETEDTETNSGLTFSRPNEVNVIRHFIKELKKIRGE